MPADICVWRRLARKCSSPHIFISWFQIFSNFLSKDHTFLCLSGSGFPCHWLNLLWHAVCLGLQLPHPVVSLYFQGLVISQLKLCTSLLAHASLQAEKNHSVYSDLGFHLMENYTCLWPTRATLWNIWQMEFNRITLPIILSISWSKIDTGFSWPVNMTVSENTVCSGIL